MSDKVQLPPEIAEYWGKLTPRQQSMMVSRIIIMASGNEYHAAMKKYERRTTKSDEVQSND